MHCNLVRRLPRARAGAVAAALGVLAVAGTILGAGPAAADGAGAAFTATRCLSGDGWGATLSITAAHPEQHPVAHVSTSAGPYAVAVPSGGYTTLMTGMGDRIVIGVGLSWSDATTQDLGVVTAERPGTCGEASAVATTPPTTTCAEAIPPRDDCARVAVTAPATTLPAATGAAARLDVEATLLALPASAPVKQQQATAAPSTALPATGSFPGAVIATGIAALVAGVGLVLMVRRAQ